MTSYVTTYWTPKQEMILVFIFAASRQISVLARYQVNHLRRNHISAKQISAKLRLGAQKFKPGRRPFPILLVDDNTTLLNLPIPRNFGLVTAIL